MRQSAARDRAFAHLDVAGGTGDVAFRIAAAGGARHARHRGRHQRRHAARSAASARRTRGLATPSSFVEGNAEALPFADRSFDAYTIAFGIRNVPRIERGARRGASRAEARRAVPLPGVLARRRAGARPALRRLLRSPSSRRSAGSSPATARLLPLSRRIRSASFPDAGRFRRHDRGRRLRAA